MHIEWECKHVWHHTRTLLHDETTSESVIHYNVSPSKMSECIVRRTHTKRTESLQTNRFEMKHLPNTKAFSTKHTTMCYDMILIWCAARNSTFRKQPKFFRLSFSCMFVMKCCVVVSSSSSSFVQLYIFHLWIHFISPSWWFSNPWVPRRLF